jgi:stalled ribosome alternative rescue factor ArfA
MKQRKPRKPRNLAAKALIECKIFRTNVAPIKRGKGSTYSRKSRNADQRPSGFDLLRAA